MRGMLVRSKNRWLYRDVTRQTKNCSVWSAFELVLPLWWWPAHLSRDNSGGSATLYSFSFWGYSTTAQFLPTRGSSLSATRSTRTSRRSSPSRRPCGALLPRVLRICILRFRCIRHFVINIINNFRTRFIMSFYMICAVIYCSFCCIYVWLDPGTYMIARFMSFYKPGVTRVEESHCSTSTLSVYATIYPRGVE